MHTDSSVNTSILANTDFLRRYARNLLRNAHANHPSKSLPVLRRVHAAESYPIPRLTDLYHARLSLRLKHVLHTIAVELGYATWAECKRDVDHQPSALLDRFRVDVGTFGDFNKLWFRDIPSAQAWQAQHGGHVVVYGTQAVVMTA
jgi:hypothetical protein